MTKYSISKDFYVFIIEEGKKFIRFEFIWGRTLIYGKYFVYLQLICCQNSDENMLISCEIWKKKVLMMKLVEKFLWLIEMEEFFWRDENI